jgi:hypothetical protein
MGVAKPAQPTLSHLIDGATYISATWACVIHNNMYTVDILCHVYFLAVNPPLWCSIIVWSDVQQSIPLGNAVCDVCL